MSSRATKKGFPSEQQQQQGEEEEEEDDEEEDFHRLHCAIYDYFSWFQERNNSHPTKSDDDASPSTQRQKDENNNNPTTTTTTTTTDVSSILNALESVFPDSSSLADSTTTSRWHLRPHLLVSTIQKEIKRKQVEMGTNNIVFVWDNYYESLKEKIQNPTKSTPKQNGDDDDDEEEEEEKMETEEEEDDDKDDDRGFRAWCICQRWVYQKYHNSSDSQQDENHHDDLDLSSSSHLTTKRIEQLNQLGFQWDSPDDSDQSEGTKQQRMSTIHRGIQNTRQCTEWTQLFERYKPFWVERQQSTTKTQLEGGTSSLPTNKTTETGENDLRYTKEEGRKRRRAEEWLQIQIRRYKDWDAGFVDFPMEQRKWLNELDLLPPLNLSEHRHLIDKRKASKNLPDDESSQESHEDTPVKRKKKPTPPTSSSKKRKLPSNDKDGQAEGRRRSLRTKDNSLSSPTRTPSSKKKKIEKSPDAKNDQEDDDDDNDGVIKSTFERRYAHLLAFKEKYGHVRVTAATDPSLATWAKKERQKLRNLKDDYPVERKEMLDKLEFCWEPMKTQQYGDNLGEHIAMNMKLKQEDETWFERLDRLKEYKEKFGHLKVPRRYPEDQSFADWMRHQKERYRKTLDGVSTFPKRRLDALEALGFGELFQSSSSSSTVAGALEEGQNKDGETTTTEGRSPRLSRGGSSKIETLVNVISRRLREYHRRSAKKDDMVLSATSPTPENPNVEPVTPQVEQDPTVQNEPNSSMETEDIVPTSSSKEVEDIPAEETTTDEVVEEVVATAEVLLSIAPPDPSTSSGSNEDQGRKSEGNHSPTLASTSEADEKKMKKVDNTTVEKPDDD